MYRYLTTSSLTKEDRPLEAQAYFDGNTEGRHVLELRIMHLGETRFSGLTVADLEKLHAELGAYLSDLGVCETFGVDDPLPYGVIEPRK